MSIAVEHKVHARRAYEAPGARVYCACGWRSKLSLDAKWLEDEADRHLERQRAKAEASR